MRQLFSLAVVLGCAGLLVSPELISKGVHRLRSGVDRVRESVQADTPEVDLGRTHARVDQLIDELAATKAQEERQKEEAARFQAYRQQFQGLAK